MERKQLDLDAPLLSVRRFSSTLTSSDGVNKKKVEKSLPHRQHSLPIYKSDWELDEVTKPAAVPFLWEQIPGKRKGGNEAEAQSPVESSDTPRLPPGRALDVPKQLLEEVYKDRNVFKPQIEVSPLNDGATLWESLNKVANVDGDFDSEREDDEYSDALDTLSPTGTLSMDCSASGLSSYDGSDAKPCGTFSADTQTRDFMMKRFLPAAKAMVLHTPHYVSKKQPMTPEHPRLVKKVISGERRPLLEQQRSAIVPHYGQYVEDIESEDEDEDEEIDDSGKKSVKPCGLFSRFFLKNSLCLLNPVPGMKARAQVRTSSSKEVSRLARTTCSGPLAQIADKHSLGAVYRPKLGYGAHSHELHKVKSKTTGQSNWLSYSGDLGMMHGSSPYRCFSRGGISPYRNEAPRSPLREGLGFLGVNNDVENVMAIKACSNSQDVSCHQRYKQVSGSMTPTVEKTLYIDSVNIVELPLSESISSGVENLKGSSGNDFGTCVDSSRMEEIATAESFVQDIRCLHILEGVSLPSDSGSVDADTSSSARISKVRSQADRIEGMGLDQGQDQQSVSSDCSKFNTNGNLGTNNEHIPKAEDQGDPNVSFMPSPTPPPLPKSPSESWLWRTLPSISLRHPFSHAGLGAQFHPKKQHAKASNTGTKWETIVKTSNVHHDHVRYSEELVPHVSQRSKT